MRVHKTGCHYGPYGSFERFWYARQSLIESSKTGKRFITVCCSKIAGYSAETREEDKITVYNLTTSVTVVMKNSTCVTGNSATWEQKMRKIDELLKTILMNVQENTQRRVSVKIEDSWNLYLCC